jgi:hypothetical protein
MCPGLGLLSPGMAELEAAGSASGRLEPIAPREVWKHETHAFKQWLTHNADILADVLALRSRPVLVQAFRGEPMPEKEREL